MWKRLFSSSSSRSIAFISKFTLVHKTPPSSFCGVLSKVFFQGPAIGYLQFQSLTTHRTIHSSRFLEQSDKLDVSLKHSESSATAQDIGTKPKRKKLKGKRAVVRWLKHFRFQKKKEYQRMTEEEKILYKLNKARKKETRLIEALQKLEPKEWSEATHDPEVLTPEEHFYFLKMGLKCKNYVPVGRRGIYQGVILNMHLHWKKHQTLQVIVKTFTPEEVREIAVELAKLTGGIVLEIHEENTIIMYRGKNYSQPPTEIMSPRVTLPRKKALDKSHHRDGLRALRRVIPRLEQELGLLRARARNKEYQASEQTENSKTDNQDVTTASLPSSQSLDSDKLNELMDQFNSAQEEGDSSTDASMNSDSEDLSDIFETESDREDNAEPPLYLHEFDKFPAIKKDAKSLDEKGDLSGEGADLAEFDEIDQMFLRAAELLRKKRR